MLTNKDNTVKEIEVRGQLGTNDHSEVRFKLKCVEVCVPNSARVPDFRREDYEGLRRQLD